MANDKSPGKIGIEVTMGSRAKRAPRNADSPFCIAVLGDFTGRASRGLMESAAERRPVFIDVDNFDRVMEKMAVCLRLPDPGAPGQAVELGFASLEEFHPDEILKQAPSLAKLLDLRKRLKNPGTYSAASAELQALLSVQASAPSGTPGPAATVESNDAAVARLLGKTPSASPVVKPATGRVDISSLIKSIVAPNIVPNLPAQQAGLAAALDLELTQRLRSVLQHPQFQMIESAWRAADFLVRNLDAENLKLYLVDISKDELAADLRAQEELQSAGIYSAPYGQPCAVLVGNYTFDESAGDADLLRRMAVISAWLGSPFIAGASPHLVGCESFGLHADPKDWKRPLPPEGKSAWQALRQMPEASYVGLALPRFLLRQPYGKGSDDIETFPFEELPGPDSHEGFLWGNSAFLCGYLLAEAFKEEGWGMGAVGSGDIGDMPLYYFSRDGEKEVKPCAEAWLTERAGDAILDQGLMAVLSIKGQDAVRLAKMQSVSSQSKALALR